MSAPAMKTPSSALRTSTARTLVSAASSSVAAASSVTTCSSIAFSGGRSKVRTAMSPSPLEAWSPHPLRRYPAITCRWISEVPSTIWKTFASRIHFSTGWSRMIPAPPRIWTASVVARIAASAANAFA